MSPRSVVCLALAVLAISILVFIFMALFSIPLPFDARLLLLAIPLLLVLWATSLHRALVRGRNHCYEAWSDVGFELRRRHGLIPNLVNTAKGHFTYENEVLERVTLARNAAVASRESTSLQARAENALSDALRRLLVVVEGSPDLNASQSFLILQRELADTEDRIQRARRFYNSNVWNYNNRVRDIPSTLIARPFGFKERELFEIESAVERQAPVVKM